MESTVEARAREVCDMIKLSAVGLWEPCKKLKPHLWEAVAEPARQPLTFEEKCFKWDFLHITTMSWWAVNLAKFNLPPAQFRAAAHCIEEKIGQWNPGVIACFSDLNAFVQRYEAQYQKMTDPKEVVSFTKLIVGTWLLWNLTDKARFNDESELAGMLGETVHRCVAGCWDVVVSSPETKVPERIAGVHNVEGTVHKSLIEKAKDAPILFRILMDTLKHSLERDYPRLIQCPGWNDFVMAATVGGCTSLAIRLHFEVDKTQRSPLELQMRELLQQGFPDSEGAYVECYRFVTESLAEIPRAERGKYLFLLIAMWVMGVVTEGGQIDGQEYVMARIAEIYQNETGGFWSEPQVG